MTIKEALKDGGLEAEVLLAYVLGYDREYLIGHGDEDIEIGLLKLFLKYMKEFKDGKPVAYITKGKEFYGMDFFVDERVLIPRPETEMLVEDGLKYLASKNLRKIRILDVGTGSGNIAISLLCEAQKLNENLVAEVDAVDISEDALEVAKINVQQYGVENEVHVFQSDLLENIDDSAKYDVIVTNLPYIGERENNFVEENVKKYEPNGALFAGDDGLKLYEKLFSQIKEKNIDFGILIGEFGFGQTKKIKELLSKFFAQKWRIEKDLAGIDRMFVVTNS